MDLGMTDFALAAVFLLVAALFSSVGHAGASGYLAAMALLGVPAALMKPTALLLNVCVGVVGTWRFARAGLFRWGAFWPLVLTSVPCAWLASQVHLSDAAYRRWVAVALAFAGARLVFSASQRAQHEMQCAPTGMPKPLALFIGAGVGTLAGLTGTGGGIFLTPLLLARHWVGTRQAAAVTAPFVLVNSLSGLLAQTALPPLAPAFGLWLLAVSAGALLGTQLGTRWFSIGHLRRVLGVILWVAAAKLAFG